MSKNAIYNMFTFGNLASGIIALMIIFQQKFVQACFLILLAAVFDRYNGKIAGYLKLTADSSKELDSAADLVSFGIAPSFLIFNLSNFSQSGIMGYFFLLIFPAAAAFRIINHNTFSSDDFFTGLPVTAAGTIMTFYTLISLMNSMNSILTIFILTALSYLMICKFRFKKI